MKLFIQEVQMDIKQGILYKYQRYVIAILFRVRPGDVLCNNMFFMRWTGERYHQ